LNPLKNIKTFELVTPHLVALVRFPAQFSTPFLLEFDECELVLV
jgi:hypothetical protein